MKKQELNIKAWVVTAATMWGVYLFLFPFFIMAKLDYYWFSKNAFVLLQSIYPGLKATVGGAFFGLLHGIICGAVCGGLFAWIHNWFLKYF
jgi:hypothetical protein